MTVLVIRRIIADIGLTLIALGIVWFAVTRGGEKFFTPAADTAAEDLFRSMAAGRYEAVPDHFIKAEKERIARDTLRAIGERWTEEAGRIAEITARDVIESGDSALVLVELTAGREHKTLTSVEMVREDHLWKVTTLDVLRNVSFRGGRGKVEIKTLVRSDDSDVVR